MSETALQSIFSIDITAHLNSAPELSDLQGRISTALEESRTVEVITPGDVETASLYVKKFKQIESVAEASRKNLLAPVTALTADVNSFFKRLTREISAEKQRLLDELNQFDLRQKEIARRKAEEERRKREEEERRLREELEARKAEMQAQMQDNPANTPEEPGVEIYTPSPAPEVVAVIPDTIQKEIKLKDQNSYGITSYRKKTWVVTDFSLVPREFLTLDEKKLDAFRKDFDFELKPEDQPVPGIQFTFEQKVR